MLCKTDLLENLHFTLTVVNTNVNFIFHVSRVALHIWKLCQDKLDIKNKRKQKDIFSVYMCIIPLLLIIFHNVSLVVQKVSLLRKFGKVAF